MAQAYVGVFHWAPGVPTPADVDAARKRGNRVPEELLQKVMALPAQLPATCKLVGSYIVGTSDIISFMVVEAEGLADLNFINDYYSGWIEAEWHPTQLVARN